MMTIGQILTEIVIPEMEKARSAQKEKAAKDCKKKSEVSPEMPKNRV